MTTEAASSTATTTPGAGAPAGATRGTRSRPTGCPACPQVTGPQGWAPGLCTGSLHQFLPCLEPPPWLKDERAACLRGSTYLVWPVREGGQGAEGARLEQARAAGRAEHWGQLPACARQAPRGRVALPAPLPAPSAQTHITCQGLNSPQHNSEFQIFLIGKHF